MTVVLHGEYVGTVCDEKPWGVTILLDNGAEVTVDRIKAGAALPLIGERVVVVVLDDERVPPRASMLDTDREIAAGLRATRPTRPPNDPPLDSGDG